MRQLSNKLLAEFYGQESSDPFLMLVTLSHSSFGDIRLVNNTEDIISNSVTYMAFPINVTLPADDGETARSVQIEIDNTTLELIDELRSVSDPIDVNIKMVLASTPDEVQIELTDLKLKNITYSKSKISGTLYLDDFMNTEMASERYTPSIYIGLF